MLPDEKGTEVTDADRAAPFQVGSGVHWWCCFPPHPAAASLLMMLTLWQDSFQRMWLLGGGPRWGGGLPAIYYL